MRHQVKAAQPILMVPIIDLIPEKFDTQIGKDTLVSLWLLLTKERTFKLKPFILCQGTNLRNWKFY
jgi:hypothetical protein